MKYTINEDLFKEFASYRDKLPSEATGSEKRGGMEGHSIPSGIMLLGAKDDKIVCIEKLLMSGGCHESPNINHIDMYKAMEKMFSKNLSIVGMALIRNKRLNETHLDNSERYALGRVFKENIIEMSNSFKNPEDSVWISFHGDAFTINSFDPIRRKFELVTDNYVFSDEFKKSELYKKSIEISNQKKNEEMEKIKRKAEEEERRLKQEITNKKRREEEKTKRKVEKEEKETLEEKIRTKKDKELNLNSEFKLVLNDRKEYIIYRR